MKKEIDCRKMYFLVELCSIRCFIWAGTAHGCCIHLFLDAAVGFLLQNGEKRDDLADKMNGVKRQRNVPQFVDRGKAQVYNWAGECINIHAKERKM